jgi:plasmid stability protein
MRLIDAPNCIGQPPRHGAEPNAAMFGRSVAADGLEILFAMIAPDPGRRAARIATWSTIRSIDPAARKNNSDKHLSHSTDQGKTTT